MGKKKKSHGKELERMSLENISDRREVSVGGYVVIGGDGEILGEFSKLRGQIKMNIFWKRRS